MIGKHIQGLAEGIDYAGINNINCQGVAYHRRRFKQAGAVTWISCSSKNHAVYCYIEASQYTGTSGNEEPEPAATAFASFILEPQKPVLYGPPMLHALTDVGSCTHKMPDVVPTFATLSPSEKVRVSQYIKLELCLDQATARFPPTRRTQSLRILHPPTLQRCVWRCENPK